MYHNALIPLVTCHSKSTIYKHEPVNEQNKKISLFSSWPWLLHYVFSFCISIPTTKPSCAFAELMNTVSVFEEFRKEEVHLSWELNIRWSNGYFISHGFCASRHSWLDLASGQIKLWHSNKSSWFKACVNEVRTSKTLTDFRLIYHPWRKVENMS